jgi:hypothetical protein
MPFFFCRLHASRPDFAATMNEAERKLMGEHGAYLRGLAEKGTAVLFGPVGDPAGAWGLGIFECADIETLRALTAEDPTIKSGQGFRYEMHPMLAAVLRPSLQRAG